MADPSRAGSRPGVVRETGRGVHAAALAELPGCGVARQAEMLARHPAPALWDLILRGELTGFADALGRWREHARSIDLDRLEGELTRAGVIVTTTGDPDHPGALVDDIDPVPVLFRRGAPVDPDPPSVAIVGTRRCSPTGRELATELGYQLTAEGVAVVSGLALGVDGAAHRGALRAGRVAPVAVVGSGLDVVYPRGNADLWRRMGEVGTLLSEAPLGTRPEAWRFPARNRIIAALADVVVVVESKVTGGSMKRRVAAGPFSLCPGRYAIRLRPGPICSSPRGAPPRVESRTCSWPWSSRLPGRAPAS
jgi:DNA processing protein